MKNIFLTGLFLLLYGTVCAQKSRIDSLLAKIDRTEDIKNLYPAMQELLDVPQGDFALLKKGQQDLAKARLSGVPQQQRRALLMISSAAVTLYDAPELLDASLQGIRISRDLNDHKSLAHFQHSAGLSNTFLHDDHKAINYFLMALNTNTANGETASLLTNYSTIESSYVDLKMPDSALFYANIEMSLANKAYPGNWKTSRIAMGDMGEALACAGHLDSALVYYRKAYELAKKNLSSKVLSFPYLINNLAKTYLALSKPDSAIRYALESYNLASKGDISEFTADAASNLSKAYEGRDDKKSLFYLKVQVGIDKRINASERTKQFQLIADRDRQHDDDLKAEKEKLYTRIRLYLVIGAAVVLLIVGIILWRNNQKQKHTNQILNEQKEEIEFQRDNLENTLGQLKITQTQLIQAEKMASLGELTAGIAHEIQNPLNFVNNFSDVNREMIDELKVELKKGDIEEAIAIADNIQQNEEKINHHGKRADSIVKGMLEHSKAGSGEKQLTNINQLADEFLKLSYHGLRAKDKSFNAELITHFDENLPKANVSQQDIGRVLLNLFNNAFYAVNQRSKTDSADYKLAVEVTTSSKNGHIEIRVKDNGNGIPDAIKDKIMQPFFTTKPTGDGTGLGLSLSYDIVVKGHGGRITMDSSDGDGAEFIIYLPIS